MHAHICTYTNTDLCVKVASSERWQVEIYTTVRVSSLMSVIHENICIDNDEKLSIYVLTHVK